MGAKVRGIRRFVARLVLSVGVVGLLLLVLVTQTPFGKEWVLREALARVAGGIHGEIEVTGISSPGLLNGFTFRDVTIKGQDGSVFLRADSVRTGLSGPALLRGDLVFTGVHVWRPQITLERLTREEALNAVAIFAGTDQADPPADSLTSQPDSSGAAPASDTPQGEGGSSGPRRKIVLRDAEIHQGTLKVLLPVSRAQRESGRVRIERGSNGRPDLRSLTFRELDLELGQATLREPGQQGERFELRNLSFLGEIWPDPIRVTGAQGDLRREGAWLQASFQSFQLPGSFFSGQAEIRWDGPAGMRVSVEGQANPLALEDLFAIEDRLPLGDASGPFRFDLNDEGLILDFRDTELASDLGRLTGTGRLSLLNEIRFGELALEMEGVDLAITDPWVVDTLPLRGRLTGDLLLDGDLSELVVESQVDLTNPDSTGSLSANVDGRMGFRDGFTASSLEVILAPLEWRALASVSPRMTLRGLGRVSAVFTGSLAGDGLGVDAQFTHFPPSQSGAAEVAGAGGISRVAVTGNIRRASAETVLNLSGDLQPLSLTTLRRSFPSLPFEGEYTGSVDVFGPLSSLETTADLETSGGPLRVRALFDGRDLSGPFSLEAITTETFALSNVLPSLPEPTSVTGSVFAQGRGFTFDELAGDARVSIRGGRVAHLEVDSAFAAATVSGGVLTLDRFSIETEVGRVDGSGHFGVASDAPPGELEVSVEARSLEPLRPFFMEVPELILDDLDPYRRRILEATGVDPDTLTTAEEIAVAGAVRGSAVLRGGLSDFTGEGTFEVEGIRFRRDFLESGTVSVTATGFPGEDARIQADIRADSVFFRSLGFQSATASVGLGKSDGRVRVAAVRPSQDRYSAQGTFALDSVSGGVVNLDELNFEFDDERWNLGGPASISWTEEGYRIRDLQMVSPGDQEMRVRADGFIPVGGREGELDLDVEGLDLSRIATIAQVETPLEGIATFHGRASGTAEAPTIVGDFSGRGMRYSDFFLAAVESDLSYQDQRVEVDLQATEGGRQVLSATGYFPLDLRLDPDSSTVTGEPIDLAVAMDSFPAAIALAFMESMEDVEGSLTGEVRFGGVSGNLEPAGQVFLTGGSARHPGLGVRHRDVEAQFTVRPDRVVEVEGSLRSVGTATVSGTVEFVDTLSNPELQLNLSANNFLAVDRRDVQGRLSGTVSVEERYRSPFVSGDLTVEEGVLFVEEVARSVEVVDLEDPTFFDVVPSTFVTLRPIIQESQNPFLQNLRLDLDLSMAQDSWLRGRELNIEMAGALKVFWDRTEQYLTFLGTLDAVRGTYSVFSRQFQVDEGTVSFPGVPGINPDLDIRALNRLRTQKNEQLEIVATVEGSLLEPRVSLSGNSAFPIPEEDLVSYLIFGQPAYAVGQGRSQTASAGVTALRGATTNLAVGLFSMELGQILSRDLGLDYLAVTQGTYDTQAFDTEGRSEFLRGAAGTQVELGQYLSEDIFAALNWRPLASGTNLSPLAALRVEGRLSDHWTLEGYLEDRFLRTSVFLLAFDDPDLFRSDFSLGFFLYREWGY